MERFQTQTGERAADCSQTLRIARPAAQTARGRPTEGQQKANGRPEARQRKDSSALANAGTLCPQPSAPSPPGAALHSHCLQFCTRLLSVAQQARRSLEHKTCFYHRLVNAEEWRPVP
eukprot:222986-Chlamydomonas_euryale.AAC.3